jgi:hypothetical protein
MARGKTAVKASTDLHPLCYEHHLEMKPVQILLKSGIYSEEILAYACPEPDCLLHYSSSAGYFVTSMPGVVCPYHGLSMYLAKVKAEKRNFRLWKCPQVGCNATRTNEEHLLGGTERHDERSGAASMGS